MCFILINVDSSRGTFDKVSNNLFYVIPFIIDVIYFDNISDLFIHKVFNSCFYVTIKF